MNLNDLKVQFHGSSRIVDKEEAEAMNKQHGNLAIPDPNDNMVLEKRADMKSK